MRSKRDQAHRSEAGSRASPVPSRRRRRRASPAARLSAALLALLCLVGFVFTARGDAVNYDRDALERALSSEQFATLRQAYKSRDFEPIWLDRSKTRPAAAALLSAMEAGRDDGLRPADYDVAGLKRLSTMAPGRSWRERARTDLLLTSAYGAYVADLHTPAASSDLYYTDRDLQPAFRARAGIIMHLAQAPSPEAALRQATTMNPLYVQMRQTLREAGEGDRAIFLKNLDRLRALPADLGRRYIVVDAASAQLWLYEDGKPVDTMKVVVGSPTHQTPQLAGLVRYAVFNPNWNVPPDLTRSVYAPRIQSGDATLASLGMDVWSDHTSRARRLRPDEVDWGRVARGEQDVWLRQRPGPGNAMGAVKFMLPNVLGIYLHDTPDRALLLRQQRALSAGCVRVEDYQRLSRWLFLGAEVSARGPAPEQRFDLPAPVPVYMLYLTVLPGDADRRSYQDPYGKDAVAPAPASTRKPI